MSFFRKRIKVYDIDEKWKEFLDTVDQRREEWKKFKSKYANDPPIKYFVKTKEEKNMFFFDEVKAKVKTHIRKITSVKYWTLENLSREVSSYDKNLPRKGNIKAIIGISNYKSRRNMEICYGVYLSWGFGLNWSNVYHPSGNIVPLAKIV